MQVKWIGTILVLSGCSAWGFSAAASEKREAGILQTLANALRFMENELHFRLTTLPVLCRETAENSCGVVREVFHNLARELELQTGSDAAGCMEQALTKFHFLPQKIQNIFLQLGISLGRFDLQGQIRELDHILRCCEAELTRRSHNREQRSRNCKTLGVCVGAALAILLI